jgi:adenine deaminase
MLKDFVVGLPKAELHVHIEGTMEPEQMLVFADRNKMALPYKSVDETRAVYQFTNYDSFIAAYLQATQVLCTEQDFYDLAFAYFTKVYAQGVIHAEIFFDVQTYEQRGIRDEVIINGLHAACNDAQKMYRISSGLIMCIIRDFSEESAFAALRRITQFKDKITGIGLASTEIGNPPSKFKHVFAIARQEGYHLVAHAGEGESSSSLREVIDLLQVERIDHGIRCVENEQVLKEIVERRIPLTVCPLSNVALGWVKTLADLPLKKMLDAGVIVSINSDDPVFFNGYIADNYYAVAQALNLTEEDIIRCAYNSFVSSFVNATQKEEYLQKLAVYARSQSS